MKGLAFVSGGMVLGVFTAAFVVFVAGYLGIWYCFVGSVVDIIEVFKAPTTDSMTVLGCLLRWFFGTSVCMVVGVGGGILMSGTAFSLTAIGFADLRARYILFKKARAERKAITAGDKSV